MVAKPTKNCKTRKTRPLAMTYVFGSFFGALMIATAFAYFNFKFTQYRFIDFNKITFFNDRKLFVPTEDKYIILIYSTKATPNIKPLIRNIEYPILAIDIHQKYSDSNKTFTHLKTSINTILQVIQKFNIYTLPAVWVVKKDKKEQYKQNSSISILRL